MLTNQRIINMAEQVEKPRKPAAHNKTRKIHDVAAEKGKQRM